ncbi:nickel/cobalt transporter [Andreprevotia chitinilytica]|uniref:nickel/cobalt transporter n=1 Tax=Andreprevotia chitinilytica TaxID=396808 RepID=UPI0006918414|nr:hypothetical protein [Andreprevotia chitinilytica]
MYSSFPVSRHPLAVAQWLLLCLSLFALLALTSPPVHAVDYFGRSDKPAPDASAPAKVVEQPQAQLAVIPEPIRSWLQASIRYQLELNASIRHELELSKGKGHWAPGMAIILLSFLYGVLHALGPGHGKVVVGSYFLTQRARISHGLLMSGWAALVQSLSAIVLVSVFAAVLHFSAHQLLNQAATLETVSYVAIAVYGMVILRRLSKGLDSCGHDHSKDGAQSSPIAPHRHQPHKASDGTPHRFRYKAMTSPELPEPNKGHTGRSMFMAGTAVGLRPCAGAIVVLLFCLANEIYPVGIIATLAMGVGVAITVSTVSLGMLGVRKLITRGSSDTQRAIRAGRIASYTGAIVITLFGLLQAALLLTGLVTPIAA